MVVTHPIADYSAELDRGGVLHVELVSEPVPVPVGMNFVTLTVRRVLVPETSDLVLKCRAELSVDGGKTWSPKPSGQKEWPWGGFPLGFTSRGNPLPISQAGIQIPQPDNEQRFVRTTFIPLMPIKAGVEVVFTRVSD